MENLAAPQILAQPQLQVVQPGELASFSVLVADTSGLTYQWLFNGANISAATSDTLLLSNVSTNNQGQYSVVLSNGSGSVTSASAALMIDSRGCGMPDSWQLAYFGNLTNTATGDFDGDGVSNLQEFLDGTNPTNSASADYRLSVSNDGGLVTAVPDQPSYTNGQVITLTATGSFHAWTGDVLTRSNTITLTMTNNKVLFAHFTPIDFYWTGPSGGDWNIATNWTPNLVPGTNDNALIAYTSATVNVSSNTGAGNLTLGSPGASPQLAGSGTLTLYGTSTWVAGTMAGSGRIVVAPGATLNMGSPGGVSLFTCTLENAGTVLWTGSANLTSGLGAVITNDPEALFEVQNNASFNYTGGSNCRFDNAGTFRKDTGSGTTSFSAQFSFNNYGAVQIQSGTLLCSDVLVNNGTVTLSPGTTNRLSDGGSATGTFTAPATSLVEWPAATYTLNPGAQLNGPGLYQVSGSASLAANTAVPLQNLNLFATLAGTGVVTVGNVLNWTNGMMSGTGRTLIAPGAKLNMGSAGGVSLFTRTLENAGTVLWTGSANLTSGTGAVITNDPGALFEVQNNASFNYTGGAACRFDNAGTFRKDTGTSTTSFSTGFGLNNYNTMDIRSGIVAASGGYACTPNSTLNLRARRHRPRGRATVNSKRPVRSH